MKNYNVTIKAVNGVSVYHVADATSDRQAAGRAVLQWKMTDEAKRIGGLDGLLDITVRAL